MVTDMLAGAGLGYCYEVPACSFVADKTAAKVRAQRSTVQEQSELFALKWGDVNFLRGQ